MALKPTGITANRETNELSITWNDNHTTVVPFALLREACPCAQCQGGHENMKKEPDPDIFFIPLIDSRETQLVNIRATGNYAITVEWGDGHDYGIYTWQYLRALDREENMPESPA
jgi:DUF971 family protein